MMRSKILKFADSPKTQKIKDIYNKALFFLQIKSFIDYTLKVMIWQKKFSIGDNL